jgi:hypothetical protein
MPPPALSLLTGVWTGSYSSFIFVSSPISPPARTNVFPKAGSDYTPAAAIFTILFDGLGGIRGKVLVNFAGTIALPRAFTGTYELIEDIDLRIVEGNIRFRLPEDQIGASQINNLHFVMRSHEEMVFIVDEALVGPSLSIRTAGGSLAQGTLKRVLPMESPPVEA